jgi:hypothetical protein
MIPLVFLGGVGLGVGEIGILKSGSFNPSMVSLLQLPLATGSISLLDEWSSEKSEAVSKSFYEDVVSSSSWLSESEKSTSVFY